MARGLGFIIAALSLSAAPAAAATVNAQVKASVLKPLTFTSIQNMNLGTIIMQNGTWSGATVRLTQAGVLTCSSPNLICQGATQVARYRVAGSNNSTVLITRPNATLVNQSDSTKTLQLVLDAPASVILPNSGNPGIEFAVGGTLTLNSTTVGGTYVGTLNVTVDYQ